MLVFYFVLIKKIIRFFKVKRVNVEHSFKKNRNKM